MSCPSCDCLDCQRDRERHACRRADIVILSQSWPWDATPDEAAAELREHGFEWDEIADVMRSLLFSEDAITSVAVGMP